MNVVVVGEVGEVGKVVGAEKDPECVSVRQEEQIVLASAGALIEANYFGRAGGQSLGERGAVAGAWWRCLD